MARARIDELFAPEVQQQLDAVRAGLRGYVDDVVKAAQASRQAGEALGNATTNKALAESHKTAAAEAREQARATAALVKAKAEEIKITEAVSNDYGLLSKAYNDAALKAKNYALQLGANNKLTKEAIADARRMGDQLKQLDATVGQHQRNVGNYSGAVGNLRMNLSQVARELPSLANGLSTFAMAIGNNLPQVTDSIADVRRENAALRAEGKPTTSVIKTLASSIFSWQTALLVVLTMLPAVAKAITAKSGAAEKAEKANKKYAESLKSIEEGARSAAAEEIAHINVLASVAADTTASTKNRERAVRDLQNAYPDYFANLSKEAIMQGQATDAINAATKALLARAAAQAAEKKFAAAAEKVYDLEEAREKASVEYGKQKAYYQRATAADQKLTTKQAELGAGYSLQALGTLKQSAETYKSINKDLSTARSEQLKYLADAQRFAKDTGNLLLTPDPATRTPRARKPRKERETHELHDVNEILKQQLELRRQINQEESIGRSITETRLDAYENELAETMAAEEAYQSELGRLRGKGFYSHDEYELRKTEATQMYAVRRAEIAVQFLQREVDNEELTAEERLEIQKKLHAAMAALVKARDAAEIKGLAEWQKKLKEWLDKNQVYISEAMSAINSVAGIISDAAQRHIADLDREAAKVEELKQKELDRIEETAKSEEEKRTRIAAAEAKADQEKRQIEARQLQARRKAAAFEKAATITQIIVETALAVVHQLATGDPYTALFRAGAAGVAGSLALARAIAAPLPQYADGTDNHPGGLAVVGEGGQAELVKEPGKKPYWVERAAVLDLKPGTRVIPQDQLAAAGMAGLSPALMRSIGNQKSGLTKEDLVDALDMQGRKLARAYRDARPSVSIYGFSQSLYNQVKK